MIANTIKRIQAGDLDAYEEIVRQYQGLLMGYAAHRLPHVDVAQDIVQLTFIRAYEQLNEYKPERDFGVWLCVICKHFILTESERQRRQSRNLASYRDALQTRVWEMMWVEDDQGPARELSALRKCMMALQTQAARVVRLRYDEQKSCQDIAESMQRSVTWVTSTLWRARKSLRECMDTKLSEEVTT